MSRQGDLRLAKSRKQILVTLCPRTQEPGNYDTKASGRRDHVTRLNATRNKHSDAFPNTKRQNPFSVIFSSLRKNLRRHKFIMHSNGFPTNSSLYNVYGRDCETMVIVLFQMTVTRDNKS